MSSPDHACSSPSSGEDEDNKVKRPMNAFMIWSKKMRKRVSKENPDFNAVEISKQLGREWKGLIEEERWPFIEESKRLMEAHRRKHPNFQYNKKRYKPQPYHRFPKDMSSYHSHTTSPKTLPQRESPQAAARSLWNIQQGQYSGMPDRGRLYTGAQNSASPVYSYGHASPMGAANGSYSSSTRPSYSYTPTNNWSASGVPELSIPVNGIGNNIISSLPGPEEATANGLLHFDSTHQAASFNFSECSATLNASNPINNGKLCSMQPVGSASAYNLDNHVGTSSSLGNVETYQRLMLEKNLEGESQQEFDLRSMVNIYLGNPPGAIVNGIALQNKHAADHFRKYSAASVEISAGIFPDYESNLTALAPVSIDS